MSRVTCQISMSLDGYVAGPDQSVEDPLGKGGTRLHDWVVATESWRAQHGLDGGERNADSQLVDELVRGVGAYVMGRRMFGGGEGPWDATWTGGGARTRRSTPRSSCSPTTRASRWRCTGAPRSRS